MSFRFIVSLARAKTTSVYFRIEYECNILLLDLHSYPLLRNEDTVRPHSSFEYEHRRYVTLNLVVSSSAAPPAPLSPVGPLLGCRLIRSGCHDDDDERDDPISYDRRHHQPYKKTRFCRPKIPKETVIAVGARTINSCNGALAVRGCLLPLLRCPLSLIAELGREGAGACDWRNRGNRKLAIRSTEVIRN